MSNAATARVPRTGQQYSIHSGDYQAVITELGAGLRSLQFQGTDILASYDPDELVPCSNGSVLVPFPNRIEDAEYCFDGQTYRMPIDEHERNTAIHGFGYRYYWQLVSLTESSVTLSWRVPALAAYPFDVSVSVTYSLSQEGLRMKVQAHNHDTKKAPWAFGIHPWLANGFNHRGDEIQEDNGQCTLQIPCKTHVRVNERLLPVGEEPAAHQYDLRTGMSLKGQSFDDAWCDPERDERGYSTAIFTRPDSIRISLWADDTINAWQVCTGTGFDASFRPAGVAVEPMTAYANAFRSGKNLVALEPGQSYSSMVGYHVEDISTIGH